MVCFYAGKSFRNQVKIEIRSRLYYNCQHLKTIKIVWVFLEFFFLKKNCWAKSILVLSPLGEVACQFGWVVVWFWSVESRHWLTSASLKQWAQLVLNPDPEAAQALLPTPALPRTVHFLLLMSYPVLSRPDFTCHKWVSLVIELCNLRSHLK